MFDRLDSRMRLTCLLSASCLAAPAAHAQVFVSAPQLIPSGAPGNASDTEDVDFGDVDLDGDWDVALADGGDSGNDQNRVWINLGGLQVGLVGSFADETDARFPTVLDDSRGLEFVDFDDDSDLDLYIVNTSSFTNQSARWWDNVGLAQGGALGFYSDSTSARWVGIGASGSSVAPSLSLPSGGFVDWSGDGNFADFDNDGDLDLFHTSYGPNFGAQVPSRVFLNDGAGHFSEFNPGGFQLSGSNIATGNPGLWAQGTQQANTTNSTGQHCDIATSGTDVDLGDLDGDFDVDVLLGAIFEVPRIFRNQLDLAGGLAFRDVSHFAFPPNWATGQAHYEQELGDLDADGDLDIYGMSWGGFQGFEDATLRGTGSGTFAPPQLVPTSQQDESQADFLDYDRDGKLDVFVANFSGADRLYRNNGLATPSGLTFVASVQSGLTQTGPPSLDADPCDLDGDGDVDVLLAEGANPAAANVLYLNTLNVADSFAPRIPKLEQLGDASAGAPARVVRGLVYDNESDFITARNTTELRVEVQGFELPASPMTISGGQVFRGELAGNLVGAVEYYATSSDRYGNTGSSLPAAYVSSTGLSFASSFGVSTPGSLGELQLVALSVPFAGTALYLGVGPLPAGVPTWLFLSDAALSVPLTLHGLTQLNLGGALLVSLAGSANTAGTWTIELQLGHDLPAGSQVYGQAFALDGVGGFLLAASRGLALTSF